MTLEEWELEEWEQANIEVLTSREMGAWLHQRDKRLVEEIRIKICLKFAEQGTLVNANIFERCVKEVLKRYTDD